MTSYHINIGYSACSGLDYEQKWELLKSTARTICDHPEK